METKIKTQNAVIRIIEQEEFTKIELLNIKSSDAEKHIIFYADNRGIPGIIGPCISFSLDEVLNPIRNAASDMASGKEN